MKKFPHKVVAVGLALSVASGSLMAMENPADMLAGFANAEIVNSFSAVPPYGFPVDVPAYGIPAPTSTPALAPAYGIPAPTPPMSADYGFPAPTATPMLTPPPYGFPTPTPPVAVAYGIPSPTTPPAPPYGFYAPTPTPTELPSIPDYGFPIISGDVLRTGRVTSADATAIARWLIATPEEQQRMIDDGEFCDLAADVNGDGEVTVADLTALVRRLMGLD